MQHREAGRVEVRARVGRVLCNDSMNIPIRQRIFAATALLAMIFAVSNSACAQTSSANVDGSGNHKVFVWPVYDGQAAGDHYSSLSQINRKNVRKLQVAWKFDAGEEGGLETSPIIVGRILYACFATQKVIALDVRSGKLIWKFDSGIKGKIPIRGLSY